jgi:signal transduction histidine kinase
MGSLKTAASAGIAPGDVRSLIDNAIDGGESMAAIINNLLELSRAQAGRLELSAKSVDISALLRRTVETARLNYPDFSYTVLIPPSIPALNADPVRLERILYNLIENAAKYSPAASEIVTSIKVLENKLVVSVADKGMGIPKERQQELFEPFARIVTQAEHAKGLGLGLVVCKRLVEAHGGAIWVESEKGMGSTFFFSLPI